MLESLHFLALGMHQAFTLTNIFWVFIGGFLGTIIGMLPGLGPATGVAVLIPLTYGMDPTTALITMAGIYYGAMYGGSRASILINTPGDSGAIVSCWDGYPMARNGQAGKALAISAWASFVGGSLSVVFLVFLTMPVANMALQFGPAEMFSLLLFALTATVTLSKGNLVKGFISLCLGFMISTIGIDAQTGVLRFTMGIDNFQEGIDFLVVMIGLYAVAEVYKNYSALNQKYSLKGSEIGKVSMTRKDWKRCIGPILRSTPLGFVVGVLPGLGATVATLLSYSTEKQLSKHPEDFGKGAMEGLAAPEAANNASSCGAMVPMLTLGIPGSGTTAVMLGALMMLGVQPGPTLFTQHPEIPWAVIASMVIGNLLLLGINLPLVKPLVQLLKVPQRILLPVILGLAFMGTYLINYSTTDFFLLVFFGLAGIVMSKLDIPIPPLVLSIILGGPLEQDFRRALTIGNGMPTLIFVKPISVFLLILAVLSIAYSLRKGGKGNKKADKEQVHTA